MALNYVLQCGFRLDAGALTASLSWLQHSSRRVLRIGKRTVRVSVRFTQVSDGSKDRKELARQLHSEVLKLKEAVTN